MKTVILCGGKGIRIRDVASKIPKPMVLVGKKPILWHIMNHYASYNCKDFILTLGYLSWQIKNYFLNFKAMNDDFTIHLDKPWEIHYQNHSDSNTDWKVTLAETGENAQTGARILRIKKYVENDPLFMVTYGDGLSDININSLIKFHKSHDKVATVTGVRPSGRFGEIKTNHNNQVSEFNEKPQTTGGRINGGFFILDTKRIWEYLPDREDLNFEKETLKHIAEDEQLMMYPHDGFWQPMDTYREYIFLNDLWDSGNIPWIREK